MIVMGLEQDKAIFDKLNQLNQLYCLGLELIWQSLPKTNQSTLINSCVESRVFIAIIKSVPTLLYYTSDENFQRYELLKLAPNWQALTQRIVSAGRKSELLLQAGKLTSDMTVIDATAGFGHDSLIIASTGATVYLIENNPLMALFLYYEYEFMQNNKNWHKILNRISIHQGDFIQKSAELAQVNLVYLDPMFPQDSYKSAVSKTMQFLHALVKPPTFAEEMGLLTVAKNQLLDGGKVIVKRPKNAPFLANLPPTDSVSNEVVRFDRYLSN